MPQFQQDSRIPVLLLLLFFLWAFPDPPPVPLGGRTTLERTIDREAEQLQIVNSTGYGAFKPEENKWLNVTGLQEEDGFAWEALGKVKERAREQVLSIFGEEDGTRVLHGGKDVQLPLWRNISGHVRGTWARSRIDVEVKRPALNMSSLLPFDARRIPTRFERNVTGTTGDLRIDFTEKGEVDEYAGTRLQNIKAEFVVEDADSGPAWTVNLYGTHFIDSGQVLLTTTSDKYAGMWALPQLGLSEHTYAALHSSVVDRISKVIKKQKNRELPNLRPYTSVPEGQSENPYSPQCDLVAFLQQHPLQQLQPDGKLVAPTSAMVGDMEEELRNPEGSRPYTPPPLRLSLLLFSPDCGFVLESRGPPEYIVQEGNHLVGEKWEVYIRTGISWNIIFGLILAGQIYLMMDQMKQSSTPSTRSRISVYTVWMLSLGDGFIGMAFLPLGMLIDSAFPSLMATAFFAFLAVTFFDMRFLLDVWSIQVQERRRAERQAAAAITTSTPPRTATPTQPTTQTPIITAAGADTLPLPVTARQAINSGATPILLPPTTPDDDDPPLTEAARHRRAVGSMYGKFYLLLLLITFLSLHATSWRPRFRGLYMNIMCFLYLSLWIPQIYRNTMRNCRKALRYRFVLGQSILRILPVAYFYCVESNVLWVTRDVRSFLVLAAWVWTQIWILVLQDVLGPRVGIPKHWVPSAYDYHPILREDDEEARLPIGFASHPPSTSDKTSTKRTFDCAICMQNIEVPVVPDGGSSEVGGVQGMVARRLYMLTPCRHLFHTRCLEAAMRFRLQCPVCREGLPPL